MLVCRSVCVFVRLSVCRSGCLSVCLFCWFVGCLAGSSLDCFGSSNLCLFVCLFVCPLSCISASASASALPALLCSLASFPRWLARLLFPCSRFLLACLLGDFLFFVRRMMRADLHAMTFTQDRSQNLGRTTAVDKPGLEKSHVPALLRRRIPACQEIPDRPS